MSQETSSNIWKVALLISLLKQGMIQTYFYTKKNHI